MKLFWMNLLISIPFWIWLFVVFVIFGGPKYAHNGGAGSAQGWIALILGSPIVAPLLDIQLKYISPILGTLGFLTGAVAGKQAIFLNALIFAINLKIYFSF